MRLAPAFLALAAAVLLGGCTPKNPTTAKAAPAPPRPASTAPAKPPAPLSTPQTTVQLPAPQPIPPGAIPPPDPGTQPPPPPPSTRNQRPPRTNTTTAPRQETAPPVGTPAPAAGAPARAPIAEVVPASEMKRLQDEADARMQEARQLMGRISARRLGQQKNNADRIRSFLTQAEEAKRRGDMRQATELAGRALVLAKELKP
jgi:hypothetical protein